MVNERGKEKMKAKTLIKNVGCLMVFLMLFTITVNANTTTLWRHSPYTYVTSYHPSGYFSDYYKGVASVKGTDRVVKNNKIYGFAWTQIIYDVQGRVSSKTAASTNNSDSVQRKVILEEYDEWNAGTETNAYYDYGLRWIADILSIKDEI